MAPRDDEDDLFQHTSMTFGEHLEELRVALFKSVIALVIGFAIGLAFGSWVVAAIQTPLETALGTEYQKDAMEFVRARLPAEMQSDEATLELVADLVYKDKLLPEERYFSPVEMLDALKRKYPQEFTGISLPAEPAKAGEPATADAESPATGTSPNTASEDAESDTKPGTDATDERPEALAGADDPRVFSKKDMIRLFVWRPMSEDERLKLDSLSVTEPFVIYLKASFLFGAVLSAPFVFYYLWQFVAAGLYPHEKRYVHLFLPASVTLFLIGAAGAFFFVFPPVLGYFFWIGDSIGVQMRPRMSEWLSFVLMLPLGFGLAFQLPLLMLFLERIHVFSIQVYLAKWRIAVLLMAIAAMVLSPGGDPYSMMMMLVPLIGLYFGGIGLCKWLPAMSGSSAPRRDSKEMARVD